jgi:hypothetical protein
VGKNWVEDDVKPWIISDEPLELMENIISACSKLLQLLRLADSQKGCLTKLYGTVQFVKKKMQAAADEHGPDSLHVKINAKFLQRYPELVHDRYRGIHN